LVEDGPFRKKWLRRMRGECTFSMMVPDPITLAKVGNDREIAFKEKARFPLCWCWKFNLCKDGLRNYTPIIELMFFLSKGRRQKSLDPPHDDQHEAFLFGRWGENEQFIFGHQISAKQVILAAQQKEK
jgi:hypothetical protein